MKMNYFGSFGSVCTLSELQTPIPKLPCGAISTLSVLSSVNTQDLTGFPCLSWEVRSYETEKVGAAAAAAQEKRPLQLH